MAGPAPSELERLDQRDREYAEQLDAAEREVMVSTILRYQRTTSLSTGDPLPLLELHRLEDGSVVELGELVVGRPLVLVFGSFT